LEVAAVRTSRPELSVAWVAAVVVLVLAIYWHTAWSMVETWRDSATYSHQFLIVPAVLWMVWDRRVVLSHLPIRPSWIGLLGLVALGLGWLVGDLASANAPAQFAVVAMVPTALATVLGAAWVRALAFPLVFLFFAVPLGDALVPYLTDWTADFAVAALKLSGVPVYREGNNFSIPSGDWSVIDACSGIRYLFACFTVATLYAWIIYRATTRRLLFVAGAVVIAIFANWVRAYLTVLVAHLSDNRFGTGFDHIVFAEVLYGVVLLVVFWLGTLWREDRAETPIAGALDTTAGDISTVPARRSSISAPLAVAAILSIWPLVSASTGAALGDPASNTVDIAPRAGWVNTDEPVTKWQPQTKNPSLVRLQTFTKEGQRVSVFVGVFGRPTPESKLTSSANQLVGSQDPHWSQIERGSAQVHRGGDVITVGTSTLVGREARIVVWHWYWVDGVLTASPIRAALAQVLARIRGRSETSAWVTVYSTEGERIGSESLGLGAFVTDMIDSIDHALRAAAPF
jgi:exosortase A